MARKRYSRLASVEERKNIRRAFTYGLLTLGVVLLFIFLGLPILAKFAGFLTDLRKSSLPIEQQDTTPPAPPRIETLKEATNELKVEIKGTTEPGATVILSLNGKNQEVLANREGDFSFTFSLRKGENTVSAKAKDEAGNESQETDVIKITFDDDKPALSINSPEDGSEFFGSRERQVVIEGETENNATLNINDRLVVVDEDGTFAFATTLSEGENVFNIKTTDKAGNTTEETLTLRFTP